MEMGFSILHYILQFQKYILQFQKCNMKIIIFPSVSRPVAFLLFCVSYLLFQVVVEVKLCNSSAQRLHYGCLLQNQGEYSCTTTMRRSQ